LFSVATQAKQGQSECERFLSEAESPLNRLIAYAPLETPEVTYKYERDGKTYEKVELAEILTVDDRQIQEILDYVHARGGQVRLMKARVTAAGSGEAVWEQESPYFWVNPNRESRSYLIPVIGIDLTRVGALASLAHEFEHFKIWWDEYQLALEREPERITAAHAAIDKVWEFEMVAYGERRAVDAELKVEREFADHPFNRLEWKKSSHPWQRDYVNRITYPEFEAVRLLLLKQERADLLEAYIDRMLDTAIGSRQNALASLSQDHELTSYWREQTAVSLLIQPFGIGRLERDKTLEMFQHLVREKCLSRIQDYDFCK